MKSIDPTWPLQVGIYQCLNSDSELSSLASVYDIPPEGASMPYVVISEALSIPANLHNTFRRETSWTIHTWSQKRSNRIGNQIAARVVALLDHQERELTPLVEAHTVVSSRWEFSQTLNDPHPDIRHRVDRFRIITAQEE